MKKYFKLFEECYIISGNDSYTLYNIITGNIFEITSKNGYFCTMLENNLPIEAACEKSGLSLEEAEKFISDLEKAGLGILSNYPIAMDKLNILPKWIEKMYFKQSITINKATIDMGFECDNNCDFCNNNLVTNKFRCVSCNGTNTPISENTAYKIIDILTTRECKELYLKNGDLLSDQRKLKRIIDYAKINGIENISLNMVKPINSLDVYEYIKSKKISLILQRYIDDKTSLDTIINEAQNCIGIDLAFFLITDMSNSDKVKQMALALSQQFNFRTVIDFIVSKNINNISDMYFKIEGNIGSINLVTFSIRQIHNECFYKNCYFDSQGNIFPCAGLTTDKLGDIYSLPETFNNKNLSKFWDMALYKKDKCINCSLRYACNNCESLNYNLVGNHNENVLCNKRF